MNGLRTAYELYRIPDASLLTGVAPWQLLTTVDTNLTGYEGNFLPGFARDMYGNLIAGPVIQMFMSISDPPPPWNASPDCRRYLRGQRQTGKYPRLRGHPTVLYPR